MGAEMVGDDFAQGQLKDGTDNVKPNQGSEHEEPINSGVVDGSHGTANGTTKGKPDPASSANFPKDAVDEWPAPKPIHCFYFARFRSYEDPKLKAKIDQADKEIQKKNQARFQLTEAIKGKRAERAAVIAQLKPLTAEVKRYRMVFDEKRKELEPIQAALGKLRNASNTVREKGVGLCSSEEELNELIASMHYRMQHESITLGEEKQMLREIKQLEGTRDKVIANAAMKAKIQDSLGEKEALQDQVKLIGGDLDGVRKEQQTVRTKIKQLEEELKAIDSDICSLQEELTALTQKKDKAFENLVQLRKQREEGNSYFYQHRSLLNNARNLAAKKDITGLQELSHAEMEKFMLLWNSDKDFRDDYEKRILPSLDIRQLSRDGRMRNPDEKPILSEVQTPSEPEVVPAKANTKRAKESVNVPSEAEPVSASKAPKETNSKPPEVALKAKSNAAEDFYTSEKPKESPAANGIDEEKLKEMKREEEIAKAKQALERKRKLAEKAAAKAAMRAQKEAEKKIKEREKKARKKVDAVAAATAAEAGESEADNANLEPEKEANVAAPAPASASPAPRSKEPKETVRSRIRPKGQGQDSLPKVILKRKKSPSYWQWAVPASAVAFVILAAVVYRYIF